MLNVIRFLDGHVCKESYPTKFCFHFVSTNKNIKSFRGLLNIQTHIQHETFNGTPSEQTLSKREEKVLLEMNLDANIETSIFQESDGKNLHFSYWLL